MHVSFIFLPLDIELTFFTVIAGMKLLLTQGPLPPTSALKNRPHFQGDTSPLHRERCGNESSGFAASIMLYLYQKFTKENTRWKRKTRMKTFKVALVQHKVRETNAAKNTALAVKYIEEAKKADADLVLFPECFLTSYQFPDICKKLLPVAVIENDSTFIEWCENALDDDCIYLEKIKEAARKFRIGVEITCLSKGKKYPQNTAFLIDRTGHVIMKYSKVHTCDFDVERYLENGEEFKVCQFDGICIGTMICYDREYPESARELMMQGAELILLPNDCDNIRPFRLRELSVEAMQNMVGIAMANPPGENAGGSCAFHPMVWGCQENSIIIADEDIEGLVYAEFDIEAMRNYRNTEDLGKFRKPGAYKHLCNA